VMAPRAEAWEGKHPGSVWSLLADPRWEKRFVRFLELSGVDRNSGRRNGRRVSVCREDGYVDCVGDGGRRGSGEVNPRGDG
jgi:hypothetical protein